MEDNSVLKDPVTPLQFVYSHEDFVSDVWRGSGRDAGLPSAPSRFDATIRAGWSDRMARGLLRYRLPELPTRTLPGPLGFVAQLNVERGAQRRKPQEILSVQQQFNAQQFNFNKVERGEIVCELIRRSDGEPPGEELAPPRKMVVLVNVSPLEFGHCLFVPDPQCCFPQVLTRFAVRGGMESVLLSSDPAFRVGFNSLGGSASVNHLHLHGYYLHHELKLESVPAEPLVPARRLHRLRTFPAGFLFYGEAEHVQAACEAVCLVTDFLASQSVAHNVFLTRGCPPEVPAGRPRCLRKGVRVAVWPRLSRFGAKEESAFNVALCELAGHLPFKNKKDYELSTEKDVTEIIQSCLLPDEQFSRLEQQIIDHLLCS